MAPNIFQKGVVIETIDKISWQLNPEAGLLNFGGPTMPLALLFNGIAEKDRDKDDF